MIDYRDLVNELTGQTSLKTLEENQRIIAVLDKLCDKIYAEIMLGDSRTLSLLIDNGRQRYPRQSKN